MISIASNAVRPIGSTPRPLPPTVATMTRRTLTLILLTITALAACGDDSSDQPQADPVSQQAQAETVTLTVRVIADTTGTAGCTQAMQLSGVQVGNDSRLTVTDSDGSTIGTGTFNLSPGLEPGVDTCDWTATAEVPNAADFYNLDASGQLASYSRSELESTAWSVDLNINVRGDILTSD